MKIKEIRPYRGPVKDDGTVDVFDLTIADFPYYRVGGVVVSNSKRISLLDVNALLSHGAIHNLRDVKAIRGQQNDNLWLQFMQGLNPVDPKVPVVYEKFISQLKAAGINPIRTGHQTRVLAMTNNDVRHLTGDREIKSGDTVNFDNELRPVPGGLFDPKLTGSHGGNKWSYIKMHEPVPNPIMEEPIRRILGLTQKQYEAVLSGDHDLPNFGKGPHALAKALDNINLTKELALARMQIQSGTKTQRDQAIRKLGYLKSAQQFDLHPRDWLLDRVPVLPPVFRPVSMLGNDKLPMISDANYLYRELIESKSNLAKAKETLGENNVGPERLAVYSAFKALTGLTDPVHPKLQEKNVKGILKSIFGDSPKFGTVQRKLLSSTVDHVGRGVVAPNPDYDMDTIGIPITKAFDVYSKFIVRRLKRRGMPIRDALHHVREKTPLAHDMLKEEMGERPVILNRAPVLHRYGIMAFRPELVTGDAIRMSPLVLKGFNMDFDGDTGQFHVPTTQEAVDEAYDRMLPSRNLLAASDFKSPMHQPTQEFLSGLYSATAEKSEKKPHVFKSPKDAIAAYRRHEIDYNDAVQIMDDDD